MRSLLLEVLWGLRDGLQKTAVVAEKAEIPTDTAKVWLDDLRLLGITQRGGDPNSGYTWVLRDRFQNTVRETGLWCSDRGVPPDFAPQTPLTESKTGFEEASGVQNHPPPPTIKCSDEADLLEGAAVRDSNDAPEHDPEVPF